MELNILRGVLTAMQNFVYYTNKKLAQLTDGSQSTKIQHKEDGQS
ncbi:MAG: hypothetical protein ACJAZJ_000534 [Candidatus Endobugula sp.]|jgi:hypothetical protein